MIYIIEPINTGSETVFEYAYGIDHGDLSLSDEAALSSFDQLLGVDGIFKTSRVDRAIKAVLYLRDLDRLCAEDAISMLLVFGQQKPSKPFFEE